MKLLIAGSASHLAPALLSVLAEDERIGQIIMVDNNELALDDARLTQVVTDLRSSQLRRVMTGMDAVVLLPLYQPSSRDAVLPVALEGARNVLRAAVDQRVARLVHVSSAWVYELPARARPIVEEHARSAAASEWRERAYALGLEESLDHIAAEETGLGIVRLRPSLIVGRHGAPTARAMLRSPFSIRFAPPLPRLQCVHAQDVARAIQQALFKDVTGAFNLATQDALTLHEMQWRVNRGWVGLPSALVRSHGRLASRFGRWRDPAWVDALRHDLVLDSSHARRALGWKPAYETVKSCLKAFND